MCDVDVTTLVRQAQAGDKVAFGELAARFQSAVHALALGRLANVADAQELTQDVFVHAMRKLEQLRDPQCFPGWIRQMTVRLALNRLARKAVVVGAEPELFEGVIAEAAEPVDQLAASETRASVHAGLGRLKPTDRAALEAFYLRGRSLKQMSREFGTPVGTIKRRLHVARQRLRAVMSAAAGRRRAVRRHLSVA